MRIIDDKFHAEYSTAFGVRIIKTTNGAVVPEEEPLILFRGRDRLALPLLRKYRELCVADGCNDYQLNLLDSRIKLFMEFEAKYPERMKQPGITKGK